MQNSVTHIASFI